MPRTTLVLGEVLVIPSVAVPAVFVMVQVMTSPLVGVTENEVPVPDGRTVTEPAFAFEHEIELAYWPITEAEPAAIASVRVYVVAVVTVVIPVVAEAATPAVVAEATVDAPFLLATVNWSATAARDPTDLINVRWGFAVFVMVHVIWSSNAGLRENEVPDPEGNTVVDPERVFVHAIEPRYALSAELDPAAIASVSV